jgi:ABC-type branched-subunit amino acid transport system substrate-binding protein
MACAASASPNFRVVAIAVAMAAIFAAASSTAAPKKYDPGASDTEIKIGQTMPYSGPLSTQGTIGRTELAYFAMINEQGGVNGRKITLLSFDDAYSPPKTVEQVRRLVEQEGVLAIFDIVGTPTNAAVQRYLNDRKIPQLFAQTGGSRFDDHENFPWTLPIVPSYRAEGGIYGRYLAAAKPAAKVGVLHQDDDFGGDFFAGFKEGLGQRANAMVVQEVTYAVTDPTVDSQIISLQGSGADAFMDIAVPKVVAQSIRKAYDIGWRPVFFIPSLATSIPTVLKAAGFEKSIGVISGLYMKVPGDPEWAMEPGYQAYRAFMAKHYPSGDPDDAANVLGYSWAQALEAVLRKCGDDLTRANLMFQATHLQSLRLPMLLPGITLNTSATDYRPIKQFVLHRFDGKGWAPFGNVLEARAAHQ